MTTRTNPLKSSRKTETASLFVKKAEMVEPVQAVCQEFGSNRTIRVTADLQARLVNPMMNQDKRSGK